MEIKTGVMPYTTLVAAFLCIGCTKAALFYSIWEQLPTNTLIGNIAKDFNMSSRYPEAVVNILKYQFVSNQIAIKVIEDSGHLMAAQVIDRDVICPGLDQCTITADILVSPASYFDLIPVVVEVLDINDNTPTFPEETISITISELSTPKRPIYTLPSAVDPDSGIYALKGYKLITPKDSDLFALEESTALDGSTELKLLLLNAIDREKIPSHHLEVMAYDGDTPAKTGILTINLLVEDENDNPPIFEKAFYEVSVSENTSIDSPILRVTATDMDDGINSEVMYSLTPTTNQNFGSIFRIESNSGEIFLESKLDFKSASEYKLVVEASDQGDDTQSTQVAVFITVLDINEAPEITIITLTDSKVVQVREGELPYSVIASVSVVDPDSGENGKVVCGFDNPKFELQQLGSYEKHFKVVTTETLDRESIDTYDISLTCEDKGIPPLSTTKNVRVSVLDANDHPPVFAKRLYSVQIEENNLPHEFIQQVAASDKDIGQNARLEYRLSDNTSRILKDLFEIEGSSGVIRAKGVLDHEQFSSVTLDIIVRDHGNLTLYASAQVAITIIDQNDCKPKFSESEGYSFSILEEQLPGIDVGNVTATDADSEPYDQVAYRLEADDISSLTNFRIDAYTGFIKTTSKMDRETDPVFYFRVVAFNPNFDSWLSTTASVTVYLSDINDNGPVVDYPSQYNSTISVPNNVKLGYVITRVRAHDRDIGVNEQLSFALVDDWFMHEDKPPFDVDHPTGAITAIRKLTSIPTDTQYNLTIVVRDHGKPQFQSMAFLTIIIAEESPLFYTPDRNNVIPTDPNTKGYSEGDENPGEKKTTSLHVVIGVACGSTLVIAGLMAAILILSCKNPRRRAQEQGKYNCRVEAQKMLNEKQERSPDCSCDSGSSEEDISPSPVGGGGDVGQQPPQQALYSFTESPHQQHLLRSQQQHQFTSSHYPEASDEELHSVPNHEHSGRGISLMEYDPTHAQTPTWKPSTGQNASKNPNANLDKPDVLNNSPMKPKLSVCNSCVVTEDKNQFATRLVPLTDKEIEIHKILRFLHSQQDDVTDRCSDSMSTSDSGKGASVSEECEGAPGFNTKPAKQVHFVDQQKSPHPGSPDGPLPTNGHYQYPQRSGNRNCPSPLSTFSNTSTFGNGHVGNNSKIAENNTKENPCDSWMPQERTYTDKNPPVLNTSHGGSQAAPPNGQKYNNPYAYSTGSSRGTRSLPHQRTPGSKDYNKRYNERGAGTLDRPKVVDEDRMNGIIGNLSDDSDDNSTMSGSYILQPDELPATNVHHLSRLKDSIV